MLLYSWGRYSIFRLLSPLNFCRSLLGCQASFRHLDFLIKFNSLFLWHCNFLLVLSSFWCAHRFTCFFFGEAYFLWLQLIRWVTILLSPREIHISLSNSHCMLLFIHRRLTMRCSLILYTKIETWGSLYKIRFQSVSLHPARFLLILISCKTKFNLFLEGSLYKGVWNLKEN